MSKAKPCPECGGEGALMGASEDGAQFLGVCPVCKGDGEIPSEERIAKHAVYRYWKAATPTTPKAENIQKHDIKKNGQVVKDGQIAWEEK